MSNEQQKANLLMLLDRSSLEGEIFLFESYLYSIGDFISKQVQESDLQTGDAAYAQKLIFSRFGNILHGSFFVSLYSFLESRLNEECRNQEAIRLVLGDIRGTGIERAKTYLVKVLGNKYPFGSSTEWQEIQRYKKLRNCIVHNESKLNNDAIELALYIENHPHLSLSVDNIIIKREFCEEALHTIQAFLFALLFPLENE